MQATDLAKDFKSPGADLGGIYTFRDVQDADNILAAVSDAKSRGGKVRPECWQQHAGACVLTLRSKSCVTV